MYQVFITIVSIPYVNHHKQKNLQYIQLAPLAYAWWEIWNHYFPDYRSWLQTMYCHFGQNGPSCIMGLCGVSKFQFNHPKVLNTIHHNASKWIYIFVF